LLVVFSFFCRFFFLSGTPRRAIFLCLAAASFSTMCCRTLTVIACDKVCDNGKEVVTEVVGVVGPASSSVDTTVEYHEPAPGGAQDVLDVLVGEAAEAVFVGNHNFFDSATHGAVQNGEETFAVPVEAGADVADDFVRWVCGAERLDLAVEVGALFGGGDAGIADAGALHPGIAAVVVGSRGPVARERFLDVGAGVEAAAVLVSDTNCLDLAGFGPAP